MPQNINLNSNRFILTGHDGKIYHQTYSKGYSELKLARASIYSLAVPAIIGYSFLVQNHFLSLKEEWQIDIYDQFCRAVFPLHPHTWATGCIPEQSLPFPAVSLFHVLTRAWFTGASTDSKRQQSVISESQEQKEGSNACSDTLPSCRCSLQQAHSPPPSPHLSSNAAGFSDHHGAEMDLSSQTYSLPPFTCKEKPKFLDLLVLKSPLNLWKVSPKDHNPPYKTICNETNLEEIRNLQDIIVFRTGIGE